MNNIVFRSKLLNRAILELYFVTKTPVHVGSGQEGTLSLIVRFPVNGRLIPIIPSNSLKGTLRSLATKVSKSINFNQDTKKILELHKKDTHIPKFGDVNEKNSFISSYENKSKDFLKNNNILNDRQINELSKEDVIDLYLSLNCPICTLFGSKSLSGKINIFDATPLQLSTIITYTSASISRKTLTVEEGALYTVEAVGPGTVFEVKVITDNVLPGSNEAKVLASLLNYIKEKGIVVGGMKSKGYGVLELNQEKSRAKLLKLNPFPKNSEEELSNINALLLKDGYYNSLTVEEYMRSLQQ